MALSALDRLYKENISAYADEIHTCTQQIEQIQSRLAALDKEKEPFASALYTCEKDVDYTLRLLEKHTQGWAEKRLVLHELDRELEQLDHPTTDRQERLKSRQETLHRLTLEIENIELLLLEHELQRQNTLLEMEPIEREIKILKQSLKDLESKKRYIESAHLHYLSPTQTNTAKPLKHS